MIEAILLLGLIAVIMTVAFVLYPQVRDSNQTATEQQRLLRTVSVLRSVYFTRGNYIGLTTDVANEAKAFAVKANAGNYQAGQPISNLWGGSIQVNQLASDPKQMELTYTLVPQDACIKLITGPGRNFRTVWVDNAIVARSGDGQNIDINGIVTACGTNPAGATIALATE